MIFRTFFIVVLLCTAQLSMLNSCGESKLGETPTTVEAAEEARARDIKKAKKEAEKARKEAEKRFWKMQSKAAKKRIRKTRRQRRREARRKKR